MAEVAPKTGSARLAERPVERNSRRDAQQLHVLADEDAYEGFPALKGVMGFVEDFAALGSMPCVDELV